eukprot:SAG31_NODE_3065_length_4728_cov_2.260531_1_plen_67_part_10
MPVMLGRVLAGAELGSSALPRGSCCSWWTRHLSSQVLVSDASQYLGCDHNCDSMRKTGQRALAPALR